MENNFGIIYCAKNTINDKKYIGQTTYSLNKRKSEHICNARNGSLYAFHLAIAKYGEEAFEWSVIDTAMNREELDEKEIYWIDFYNTYKGIGYNMSIGGSFTKKDNSTIEELSIARGGKEFLVFDMKGNFIKSAYSQISFAKEIGASGSAINNVLLYNKPSIKDYILIFEDEFTKEKLQEKINKKIFKEFAVFDLEGNYIGNWNNQATCSKDLKIPHTSISRCLNKKFKQSNGYHFYYIDDIPNNLTKRMVI